MVIRVIMVMMIIIEIILSGMNKDIENRTK
jgi:hypothetical protein